MSKPFILASMACWVPVLNQPLDASDRDPAFYRDPAFRAAFREALKKSADLHRRAGK
jgi:hypothetical protein